MTQQSTGVSNVQSDLISILFHALQGQETYTRYIQDAEQGGQQDLAQFFRRIQQEDRNRATQALQLLVKSSSQSS
jgi:rubrerythrin